MGLEMHRSFEVIPLVVQDKFSILENNTEALIMKSIFHFHFLSMQTSDFCTAKYVH